jgi:hypothetical protein
VTESGDVDISILDTTNQLQTLLLTDVLVSPFLGDIDIISINKLLQSIPRQITVNEDGMTISLSAYETATIIIPPYNNAYVIPFRMLPIPTVVEELQEPEELLHVEAPLAQEPEELDLLLPSPAAKQREADARQTHLQSLLAQRSWHFESGASVQLDVRNAYK